MRGVPDEPNAPSRRALTAIAFSAKTGGFIPCARVARIDSALVGALEEVLLDLGASAVTTSDANAREDDEDDDDDDGGITGDTLPRRGVSAWSSCSVVVMFPLDVSIADAMHTAETIIGAPVDYVIDAVPDDAWMQVVRDALKPSQVSETMWIVPASPLRATNDDARMVDPSSVTVVLEPGLAFGTGEHPTTRLCLRWLESCEASDDATPVAVDGQDELVCDFGCGSGVLAIGALLLADRSTTRDTPPRHRRRRVAVGIDIDALAVTSTTRNAVRRRLTTTHLFSPTFFDRQPFCRSRVPQALNAVDGRLTAYHTDGSGVFAERSPHA